MGEDTIDLDGDGDTAEPVPFDVDGNPRFVDALCMDDVGSSHPDFPDLDIVDMGAYEYKQSLHDDSDKDGFSGCSDNCPLHYNPGQADCDQDGLGDVCALALGAGEDCNTNEKPDACDLADGTSPDADENGVPDECQRVILVDDDALPGGDGATWDTAYTHLQDALAVVRHGGEIHVAGGTYKPDHDEAGNVTRGDRYATFQLIDGVGIYGGYSGLTDPHDRDRRDIVMYETILSGDLDDNDIDNLADGLRCSIWYEPGCDLFDLDDDGYVDGVDLGNVDNSHQVVTAIGVDDTSVLDGFTIMKGVADDVEKMRGGGMYVNYASPKIAKCNFVVNRASANGAGLYFIDSTPAITGCTFQNNAADGVGGGMMSSRNSQPVIDECTFRENYAIGTAQYDAGGGGIYITLSDPVIVDSTFIGNRTWWGGGGVYSAGSNPAFLNCTFSGNSARSGGAMYNESSTVTLDECTFTANTARYDGGGIYNHWYSNATLTNCAFFGNTAYLSGGAIRGYRMELVNCVLSGNTAGFGGAISTSPSSTFINCTVSGNTADWSGGGISGCPSLGNCTLWGNDDNSGNVENAQIACGGTTLPIVNFSNIQGWTGAFGGEGNFGDAPMFVDADGLDNIVGTDDDDVRLLPGSPCVDAGDNTLIPHDASDMDRDGNTAEPVSLDMGSQPRIVDDLKTPDTGQRDRPIVDVGAYEKDDCNGNGLPDADDIAGGISEDCTDNAIPDECEADCNSNGLADSCDIETGLSEDDNSNNIPDACDMVWHVDVAAKGSSTGTDWANAFTDLRDVLSVARLGDYIWVAAGTYTPGAPGGSRESTFQLVTGVRIYGGFAGWETSLDQRDYVANLVVLSGDLDGDDDHDAPGGSGADCCSSHDTPGCSDAECQQAVCDSEPRCCELRWEDSCTNLAWAMCCELCAENITRCDNAYHVLTAYDTHRSTVLDGFTITDGNANAHYSPDRSGAGLLNQYSSHLTVANCTFTHNTARSGGAAIYNHYRSTPVLTDCTFVHNVAGYWGGALYNSYYADAILTDCVFIGNSAVYGGGAIKNSESDPILNRCIFLDNSALYGGGMRNGPFSNPALTRCTFSGNSATYGGGMYDSYESNSTLTACTFSGNSADYGGGMYNDNYSNPIVTNCTFSVNCGKQAGGAMYNNGARPTLVNCTLIGNSATNGKAIACDSYEQGDPSTVDLSTCILWNAGNEIWNNDGSAITVAFSCVQDEDPDDGEVYPGEGNIDDDPLFVDPDGEDNIVGTEDDDLRLQSGSPCIDAGDNTAVLPDTLDLDADGDTDERMPFDLGGSLRFTDDCLAEDTGVSDPPDYRKVVDMGAYEYQPHDTDDDGDVDLRNLADLQTCFTGEGAGGILPGCENFDADCDGDLDLYDFAAFRLSIPHP